MAKKTLKELKSYFISGSHPTGEQYADLIDSLSSETPTFSDQDVIKLANQIINIYNSYIEYSSTNIKNAKLTINISQQNADDQVIEIVEINSANKKQYCIGDPPYALTLKEFQADILGPNEYYFLTHGGLQKLFGNNLPMLTEGYELGVFDTLSYNISLQNFSNGKEINIIQTNIKFLNNTPDFIEYNATSSFWGSPFVSEDSVTNHYDSWDFLYIYYNADLTEQTTNISCEIYNDDTDELIGTGVLLAGQNNLNIWSGNTINVIRNLRIECNYQ